jgi:hypothetical protein
MSKVKPSYENYPDPEKTNQIQYQSTSSFLGNYRTNQISLETSGLYRKSMSCFKIQTSEKPKAGFN